MASPFSVFRRNQKVMLAVVGVLAMIAFVFLDPLVRYVGSDSNQNNPVIVETKYGKLRASELYVMKIQRDLVDTFLQSLVGATVEAFSAAQPMFDQRFRQQMAFHEYQRVRARIMNRFQQTPDGAAVETMILARKAEQMGIVVTDEAINDVIKQITADHVSKGQVAEIIAGLRMREQRVGEGRLFDALRTELLATRMSEMFQSSLNGLPPAQRWEYYLRLNRQATAEVVPLPVEKFVDKTPQPSEKELAAFFDEHKNTIHVPGSPDPGFKEPQKAAFQYFKADHDTMLAAAETQVTEEEITKYYEENKATQFRKVALPEKKEPAADKSKPEDKPEAEKKDDQKPDGDKKEEQKPAAEKKEGKKAGDEKSAEKKSEGDNSEGLEDEEEAEEDAAKPQAEAKSQSKDAPAVDKPAEVKPADVKPANAKPAAETKPAAELKPTDEKPAAEKPAETATPATTQFEPLEKVKETIVKQLARTKMREVREKAFSELSAAMKRYYDENALYRADRESDPNATPPAKLDFAALAKEHGLDAKESGLISAIEAHDGADIGKSFDGQTPFIQMMYSDRLPLFKAQASQDNEENHYLFWKTDQADEMVPTLDQVKEKVVTTWRMIKAREIALKQAEEYVSKANQEKKPLAEVVGKDLAGDAKTVGPFSWMTMGNVPTDPRANQPRLSEVSEIKEPGEAFMRAVFSLSPSESAAAFNAPQDVAYAVQLIKFERPIDEVEQDFAKEEFEKYRAVAGFDTRELYVGWLNTIEQEARLHWLREPGGTTMQ